MSIQQSDEHTLLRNDFQEIDETKLSQLVGDEDCNHGDLLKPHVTISEALEIAGFGCGTLLFCLGPFLLFCFDGAEVVVLSIVGLSLECEWDLSTFWVAALQESVFLGIMISSLIVNFSGDRWGRKPVSVVGGIGLVVTGVASGLSAVYWQLLVLRVLVGALVGAILGPCVAITAEVSTARSRGFLVSFVSLAWGVGASLTCYLAYLLMGPYDWRGLLIGTALLFSPGALFVAICPESPRFDAKMGKWDRAERTVRRLAELNRSSEGRHVILQRENEEEEVLEEKDMGIFRAPRIIKQKGKVREFIVVVVLGCFSIFVYYSLAYSMPRFLYDGYCSAPPSTLTNLTTGRKENCDIQDSVLFDLGVISLFEPFGVLIAAVFIDFVGRRKMFLSSVIGLTLAITGLYFCVSEIYTSSFFILSKFFAAQLAWSTFLLGAEGFPTEVRSFVLAVCVGFQRIGGCLGIACAQFVFNWEPRLVLVLIQFGTVVAGGCLLAVEIDTTGMQIE